MDRVRKYPIGIQTFSEIIRSGYVYVDKTDLVWQLAHYAKYVFLSRPRRFGKSLLSSTLNSYFSGNRELFEGLKMIELEQEWTKYPVLHFDLSSAKHMPPQMVKKELGLMLSQMEALYGSNHDEETLGMRLSGLIDRAYEQTGKQVVVIIDEYDAPLLDLLHEDEQLKDLREVMQEFYQRLKKQEPKIKFCFITGITKFSQLSIFSTINNLTNVTMLPQFSAICGITEQEVKTTIPNREVRIGYVDGLMPAYIGLEGSDVQAGFALKFWRALKNGDIDQAMHDMKVYLAGVPYVEGFKEKLKNVVNKEGFYEYTMYLIFSMLNVYARTQVKCAGGRVDMVVWMPDSIYVIELKVNDTAENALKQIDDKGYAIPYQADGRRVVKVGVSVDADTRTIKDWNVAY